MNNQDIAELLWKIAVAYELLGESGYKIAAYNHASEGVGKQSSNIKNLWEKGKLQDIPGVGGSIAGHLNELFKTGKVKHFDEVLSKMPEGLFELMNIRSVGPKTAFKLAALLNKPPYNQKNSIYKRLEKAIKENKLQAMEGFGAKREAEIADGLTKLQEGIGKKNRIRIDQALSQANELEAYLKLDPSISKLSFTGSLRRRNSTIGDLDLAVVSSDKKTTLEHFVSYKNVRKVVDKGQKGATVLLDSGMQVDMRLCKPSQWGSMLQYFTGSKYHNIRLREHALERKLSLSEYGIKDIRSKADKDAVKHYISEKTFYKALGIKFIPPEIREGTDEIELALSDNLPKLVSLKDIQGDIHIHTDFDFPSSHDIGRSSVEELLNKANELGYSYIGFSDHNPKHSGLSNSTVLAILKDRRAYIEKYLYNNKSMVQKVYIMLEVDILPNGNLALINDAFPFLDGAIASIHSSFNLKKDEMTKRILQGLSHPSVKVFGHPTTRMINEREKIQADWDEIFAYCKKRSIALEINASPVRLDLPPDLIRTALKSGAICIIGTDSHHKESMDNMRYGVWNARRGWAQVSDIINTRNFREFDRWMRK